MKKIVCIALILALALTLTLTALAEATEEMYLLTATGLTIENGTSRVVAPATAFQWIANGQANIVKIIGSENAIENFAMFTLNDAGIVCLEYQVDYYYNEQGLEVLVNKHTKPAGGFTVERDINSFFTDEGLLKRTCTRPAKAIPRSNNGGNTVSSHIMAITPLVIHNVKINRYFLVIFDDGNPVDLAVIYGQKASYQPGPGISDGTPANDDPLPEVDKSTVTYVKEYTGSVTFGGNSWDFAPQENGSEMKSGGSSEASTTTNFSFGGVNYAFAPQVGGGD